MKRLLTSLTLISLLLASQLSSADEKLLSHAKDTNPTLYVDDKLWITVRAHPESSAERIAVIQSGMAMTLLNHEDGADYAKVRTENNHTGWVLFRYLTPEPVAALQLAQAEKELTRLREEDNQLKKALKALKEEKRTLEQHTQKLEKNYKVLNKDFTAINNISAEAMQTLLQKKALQLDLDKQMKRIHQLDQDNSNLQSKLSLFTIGAAIIGLVIGLFIGTIPLRRNNRWRSMS